MITHLHTQLHIQARRLQLSLIDYVYGKLLIAAIESPAAQNEAAHESCMQPPLQAAVKKYMSRRMANSVHVYNRRPA